MSSTITVRGFVATQPKFVIVGDRLAISSFRLGSTERRYNRTTGQWETSPVSWYTVSCFRDMASNAYASINKGDPVIVTGRLKISEWSAGDKSGLDVEIEAEGIGHDFRWGKATGFVRNHTKSSGGKDDGAQSEPDEQTPPDPQADEAAAASGWPNAAASIASATTADAGEPTALGLVGLDEETGEVLEEAGALPPF
jgi:single-strand DNA-binding protein